MLVRAASDRLARFHHPIIAAPSSDESASTLSPFSHQRLHSIASCFFVRLSDPSANDSLPRSLVDRSTRRTGRPSTAC